MGTTTKMAIPYPEATGLVKDGWEDMKDIATQVDAKSGLVLLNTTTFSGVSSVSLPNNTFTTAFNNYRIYMNLTGVTATDYVGARLRASGSDISTANYDCSFGNFPHNSATVLNDQSGLSQTSWSKFAYAINTATAFNMFVDLFNPKLSTPTGYAGYATNAYYEHWFLGGRYTGTDSADSITFFRTSGNFTGSIVTYGYNI